MPPDGSVAGTATTFAPGKSRPILDRKFVTQYGRRVRPAILQKEMNLRDRAIVDITAYFALIGAGYRRLRLQVGNAVDESLRSQHGLLRGR